MQRGMIQIINDRMGGSLRYRRITLSQDTLMDDRIRLLLPPEIKFCWEGPARGILTTYFSIRKVTIIRLKLYYHSVRQKSHNILLSPRHN